MESAKRTLPRAAGIALTRKDGKIVGVGTIKPIRKAYAARTAEESKFIFDADTPELGYVAVDPVHRDKGLPPISQRRPFTSWPLAFHRNLSDAISRINRSIAPAVFPFFSITARH
jgi:hypothetical protein